MEAAGLNDDLANDCLLISMKQTKGEKGYLIATGCPDLPIGH